MGKVKVVGNTIHSVKVVVYKVDHAIIHFLLLKEPEGLYSFVGGAQDIEDNTIEDTARREIYEEVSFVPSDYALIVTPIIHEFIHTDPKSERFGKAGTLHIFLAKYEGTEEVRLGDDLQNFSWNSEQEVQKKLQHAYEYLLPVFNKAVQLIPEKQ